MQNRGSKLGIGERGRKAAKTPHEENLAGVCGEIGLGCSEVSANTVLCSFTKAAIQSTSDFSNLSSQGQFPSRGFAGLFASSGCQRGFLVGRGLGKGPGALLPKPHYASSRWNLFPRSEV